MSATGLVWVFGLLNRELSGSALPAEHSRSLPVENQPKRQTKGVWPNQQPSQQELIDGLPKGENKRVEYLERLHRRKTEERQC